MMEFDDSFDKTIKIEISKSIGRFAFKYGGTYNFAKQKCLFNLFNLKVPNNGYAKLKTSKVFDEIVVEMADEFSNADIDYEKEYLMSWETELPNLNVQAAEQFYQSNEPCWFVIYQILAFDSVYMTTVKYWEKANPQISIVRTTF